MSRNLAHLPTRQGLLHTLGASLLVASPERVESYGPDGACCDTGGVARNIAYRLRWRWDPRSDDCDAHSVSCEALANTNGLED